MGTTVTYDTTLAAEMRDLARSETWTATDGTVHARETLKHCLRGFTYYAVVRRTVTPANGTPEVSTGIDVALLHRAGDNSVAVKEMNEDCGPCEVDCPLSYLDMADPPQTEWAAAWREKVRAHHATKAAQRAIANGAKPGDTIVLRDGCTPQRLKVVSRKGRVFLASADYGLYRVPTSRVAAVEKAPPPPDCAKMRKQDKPYETWRLGDWEWRVLKKWQKDDSKPYARWFCAVKSPYTFGDYELGDAYVKDVKGQAVLVSTDYDS